MYALCMGIAAGFMEAHICTLSVVAIYGTTQLAQPDFLYVSCNVASFRFLRLVARKAGWRKYVRALYGNCSWLYRGTHMHPLSRGRIGNLTL